ncbi:MAG: hypothetical protein K0Q87_2977 [Neobacillus sp.]|nr:hypothetical protein [Neobacillus sp.]
MLTVQPKYYYGNNIIPNFIGSRLQMGYNKDVYYGKESTL